MPDIATVARRSGRHLVWVVGALGALAVLWATSIDALDTTATAALVIALTVGYFVEANLLLDIAPRHRALFGLVAGGVLGALAGVAAVVVAAAVAALAGADSGVPGGVAAWALGGAAVGAVLGGGVWPRLPAAERQAWRVPEQGRPIVFLAPALLFLGVTLLVPTLRTVYLSFRGRRGDGSLGVSNYDAIFGDDDVFNLEGVGGIWTSTLFRLGMVVVGGMVAVVLVRYLLLRLVVRPRLLAGAGPVRGADVATSAGAAASATASLPAPASTPTPGPVPGRPYRLAHRLAGDLDLSAPLPVLSLIAASALALLAALGALRGVVWNNVFWVVFVTGFSTILGLAIAVLADRSRGESVAKSVIFMPMGISFVGASVIWRFVYAYTPPGNDQIGLLDAAWVGAGNEPENWLLMPHWNTLFLLIIMIWIQTGFAMVVLSSAIKAVPTDMLEAARIDGASEMQRFWWVTLPQIRSTLTVVVVTLIITVLKVYDIVKVMTNGEFGTNVIANQMFDEVFRNNSAGRGSALAVLLFVAVVPLMVANVRRLRRGEQA